ncbi:MAG: COG1470 family protein [Thermoanaerobaculia bacterium]
MRLAKIAGIFALISIATPAFADVSGTWSGTFAATIQCASSPAKLQIAGPVTFSVNEPPASQQVFALGNAFAAFPDNLLCQTLGAESLPMQLGGKINGDTLSDMVLLLPAQGAFRPTGTVSGDTITLSGPADNGGSITINLTRTDSQVPTSFRTSTNYAGTYTFNGNFAYRCADAPAPTASGTALLTVTDLGRGVYGAFRLSNFPSVGFVTPTSNGECGVRIVDIGNVSLLGTLTAGTDNTFTGFLQIPDFVPVRGTFNLSTFRGTAVTPGGGRLELTLTNPDPIRAPEIQNFHAEPGPIANGEPARLVWRTQLTDKVTIDNGLGEQPAVGSVVVRPTATTIYTLTASNPGGSTSATATVTVRDLPIVQVGDFPNGFVQRPDEGGGTDSFRLVNRGQAPTTVTLTTTDDFFTFDPSSFTLAPGVSQKVTITGKARPAGAYRGTINISATGGGSSVNLVRVGMAVIPAPAGTVRAQATSARVEVASAAGQDASVSVSFTNRGTAPLVGFATTSAPFITPPDGLITIPPGQTVPVTYSVQSAQRPLDIPIGAATSRISLLYPGGSSAPSASADKTTSSAVSTTLTYLVKPTVGPGIPPPLLPGELALVVAGLGNKANATGDLLLGNIQTTPLSSFALFISGGNGVATSAALPQISPNSSIELPGLMNYVIGTAVASGTAQLRGTDAGRTTIAAIQSNTSLAAGTYSTALPVLSSDKATPAQSTIVLTGMQKDSAAQTNLFVQEMSGVAGSFKIDFLDAAGHVVASQASQAIDGFGFAELDDASPAGAAAARITNSSAAARLSAYALVTNPATSDGWLVTDPGAGSSDTTVVVPVFSAGTGAGTTLYATNRTDAMVNVSIDVQPKIPARRRAVRGNSAAVLPLTESQDTSIGPLETKAMTLAGSSGYVRITAPAGAISAAARSVVISGDSAFGSGLPVVPVSAALRSGDSRRFTAIDDASTASRDGAVPATYRTSVEFVETNHESALIRATLQFSVTTGSRTTSTVVVKKDYTLAADQSLTIADLGSEVIGPSRATIGDIRNAILDIEIVSGSGRVIPFVASIDNGSGDMIVRTE